MNITEIRLAKLNVPLVTPFKTSLRSVTEIDDLVVVIHTDSGEVGYGSAPETPLITGDTHQSMIDVIRNTFTPLLVGKSIEDTWALAATLQQAIPLHNSAKAALEIALFDLYAKRLNLPLYQVLSTTRAGESLDNQSNIPLVLKTDITISMNDFDTMFVDSKKAIAQGFDVLKVKVGNNLQQDIDSVIRLYKEFGESVAIRLDVNQAWTAQQTVQAAQCFTDNHVSIELIEQPVKADDITGLKYIAERTAIPIMADESAFNLTQVKNLIEQQAADIINIKLMKTAGLTQALAITDYCQSKQVTCMIGCMLEGSIAVAAAAHLALAKSQTISKIDLDGPSLGLYDPVHGGVCFDKANIYISNEAGLGISTIEGLQFLS
ncbi:dipeptide epimerase [Litorilituus lipolyticus]|uniref:Dipeptide epimerase n=1 Tax=Litorilituus lipolyticus TaxID=2491017 RepID=A0A502L275_9GAMM|nr:dipeptide epimerase [Litorilituus lipolyticus]TPH18060.1 dipeptide epimerase [Litorilituus lipolyticus]